jgi:hypothetical protein
MLLADLLGVLENIAPTRYAEAWDNVGLLAGDPRQAIHKALLTIDYPPTIEHGRRLHLSELHRREHIGISKIL